MRLMLPRLSLNKLFSFLVYSGLFLFLLYAYRDFDFGWHYRYGEYFLKNGEILRKDIFSWTMEGYKWVNHSWGYDLLVYLIYNNFSFLGLSIAGALISLLAFIIGVWKFKLSYIEKAILAIFYSSLVSGVIWQGLRSQVLSLLFFSLLMNLIFNLEGKKKKWIYFTFPLLFLFWANFHGSFILGIIIFISLITSKLTLKAIFNLKTNLVLKWSLGSIFASLLATLINPFGILVYTEAIKHYNHPFLGYITEWMPVDFPSPYMNIFIVYFVLLGLGFLLRRKLSDIPYILIILIVFYLALKSRRYMGPLMVTTLPVSALILKDLNLKLANFKATAFVFLVSVIIAIEIGIFTRIPMYHLNSYTDYDYCNFGPGCSVKMTEYLLSHPPSGRGLNFYDWGGYLIGKGVPAKLFIDGRMHLWKANDLEPFIDFRRIYYDLDLKKFNEYKIDWVVIPKDSDFAQKLRDLKIKGLVDEVSFDNASLFTTKKR